MFTPKAIEILLAFVHFFALICKTLSNSDYVLERPFVLCHEEYKPEYCGFPNVSLSRMRDVEDFENCGPGVLPLKTRNYFYGFNGRGITYRRNKDAYQRLAIVPRMLRDVSKRDLSVTVLGSKISIPIGLSPTGFNELAHPTGEKGAAMAIAKTGAVMVLSSAATFSLEEVAAVARSVNSSGRYVLWMQTYLYKNREETRSVVRRAERAGYRAIVVTVDSPVVGSSPCDGKNLPQNLKIPNLFNDSFSEDKISDSLTFEDLRWLVSITRLPVVAKGILTGSDAVMAARSGAAAILVSNHGGRQLDTTPASLDALPRIVKALRFRFPKVEVYIDGGVRSGFDVFKAIAKGARAVFFGRPIVWGLAIAGPDGVEKVIRILTSEFNETMILAGHSSPKTISSEHVRPTFDPRMYPTNVM